MRTHKMGPCTALLAICAGSALILAAGTALASLYDVDFDTPPHQVGQPPATGGGPPPRETVSSIPFGTPTVVATFGAMTDQPCEFDSFDGQGDQIRLDLTDLPPSSEYSMICDVLVASLAASGDFGILFDTPQVRTIRFTSSGNVNVYVPGVFSGAVGTFTMGETIILEVSIDMVADSWQVFLDHVLVHDGAFGGATEVRAIRFSTNVTTNPPGVSAAIDNITVHDEILATPVEQGTWGGIKALFRQP